MTVRIGQGVQKALIRGHGLQVQNPAAGDLVGDMSPAAAQLFSHLWCSLASDVVFEPGQCGPAQASKMPLRDQRNVAVAGANEFPELAFPSERCLVWLQGSKRSVVDFVGERLPGTAFVAP